METGNSFDQKFVEHIILASMCVDILPQFFLIKLSVAKGIGIAIALPHFVIEIPMDNSSMVNLLWHVPHIHTTETNEWMAVCC
jgi:hypothetical protein